MMNENVTAKDFKQGFVDKLLSIDIESYQLDSIDLRFPKCVIPLKIIIYMRY